ncbi:MAG TPA: antibiotic biosynthesis monooxygenase [Blastocatellia bacterium]|nr:antibiotic biosynthesis monooxygenase [Blastocatellia bacterium]
MGDQDAAFSTPVDLPSDQPFSETAGDADPLLPQARNVFVALSQFTIANNMVAEVRQAFLNRPHLVDQAPGFLRMEVISPVESPEEIWLLTYWTDEANFRAWHHSHQYRESHGQIPKGLKLMPKSARLRFFERLCS